MANLRRHFNFSKSSTIAPQSVPASADMSAQLDKHNLMNNICNCLDMCCNYIQALNALCGTGSLLARNLLQTVQNVPVYQNVAQQFLCMWDEVSKATAGASAAVKTETLMVLQELLNTLEMGSVPENPVPDSFQVIGSCLHSFIELQAQFSLSTWKMLSKLSKNFSNDAFIHSLNWKSQERNALKVVKNSELCNTIKKHYSHLIHKYDMQKSSVDSAEGLQNNIYVPIKPDNQIPLANNRCSSQSSSVTPDTSAFTSSRIMWPSSIDEKRVNSLQNSNSSSPNHRNRSAATLSTPSSSLPHAELDEVINLLSCMPVVGQMPIESSADQRIYDPSRTYQFWPQGAGPVVSRNIGNQRSSLFGGNRDVNFGYDSWIWRTDNMNCSDLPLGSSLKPVDHKTNNNNSWDYNRWSLGAGESSSDDTSSNQGHDVDSQSSNSLFPIQPRKFNSSDGLSDQLECIPDAENRIWSVQTPKTSTWPLKQSSSKFLSDPDWSDGDPQSKGFPMFYGMNS